MYSTLKPRDIDPGTDEFSFMGSLWHNSECEVVARNVVIMQQKANPNAWTPFTWDDYNFRAMHKVTHAERAVLEAFVRGGRVSRTSAFLQAGFLTKDDEGCYHVTDMFIDFIPHKQKKKQQ